MEQIRKPRNKQTNVQSTRVPRIHNEERIVSSTNGAGKSRYPHTKELNWTHVIKINTK